MKTADIKVGEVYAVAEVYQWNQHLAQRGTVVATKVARRFWAEYAYRTDNTGVEVSIEREDGTTYSKIVRPADIRQPWDVYKREHAAQERVAAEARARRHASTEEVAERIRAILPDTRHVPAVYQDGSVTTTIRMAPSEFADLLEQAFNHGALMGAAHADDVKDGE